MKPACAGFRRDEDNAHRVVGLRIASVFSPWTHNRKMLLSQKINTHTHTHTCQSQKTQKPTSQKAQSHKLEKVRRHKGAKANPSNARHLFYGLGLVFQPLPCNLAACRQMMQPIPCCNTYSLNNASALQDYGTMDLPPTCRIYQTRMSSM